MIMVRVIMVHPRLIQILLHCLAIVTTYQKIITNILCDKYLVVVLQLLGTSRSCHNNNCITKLRAPNINLYTYARFYFHYVCTVL